MENGKVHIETFYIAFAVMILFLLIFIFNDRKSARTPQLSYESDVIEGWTVTYGDGRQEAIDLPAKISTSRNEVITIEAVLPEILDDDTWVYYYCNSSNKAYIDGELRNEYDRMKTGVWGGSVNNVSQFLDVDTSDSGKKLKIVFDDPEVKSNKLYDIFYGDNLGLIISIMRQNAFLALMAVLLMFASIVITLFDITAAIMNKRRLAVAHLSVGALFASSWIVFNSRIFSLITRTYYINGTLAFMSLMLMPLPVIVYVNHMQKNRYSSIHIGTLIISIGLFMVSSILHFTGNVSFNLSETIIEIILLVLSAAEMFTVILDIKNGHLYEYRIIASGLGIAIVTAFLELIQTWLRVVNNEGFFFEIGLFVVLISGFLQQISLTNEEELKRQQAMAANESKSSFLASMSHEIRTPINSIIGMNEMIIRENRNPQIREYANQVERSGKMLLGLINDVLDFSKIEAGKMTILDVPYKTAPMINDLVQLLNERTIAKSLKSGYDIARDIPKELSGDEIHIKQIIVNLISNGVKYTKAGYVTLRVIAEKVKEPGMINLKFIVSDNGMGIKKENLDTLFDRFTRLDEQRNRSIEGSGLGLSIVKSLVDEMHGTVSVESEYGKGSSFTVVIPQRISDPEPIGDIREAIRKASEEAIDYVEQFHASRAKILIVDDNLVNLRVASELLKRTKIQIDTASGGRECIFKCRDTRYDLILMDHRMPDPDGVETLRLLREDFAGVNYDTKVIVLTANVFAGVREKYIADGFVDYLSKPIDPELLERCIIKHLDPSLIDLDLLDEDNMGSNDNNTETGTGIGQKAYDPKDDPSGDNGGSQEDKGQKEAASQDSCSWSNRVIIEKKADSILRSALNNESGTRDEAEEKTKGNTVDRQNQSKNEITVESNEMTSKRSEAKMEDQNSTRTLAERLRDVPGMNIDKTIERYGAKDDFLQILFAAIVSDGRKKAEDMKKYLAEKNYKDFGIEAHATKSSMATIYATEVSERAKKHEFACKEGRFDFVEEDGAAFVEDYLRFLDLIEAAMNG
ncbi:MAG: response regulator [Lachnospiraceae bacterium]|nr:response regulator [Lachnospiraceae bacterium]